MNEQERISICIALCENPAFLDSMKNEIKNTCKVDKNGISN
jgi:hypothetical protein